MIRSDSLPLCGGMPPSRSSPGRRETPSGFRDKGGKIRHKAAALFIPFFSASLRP